MEITPKKCCVRYDPPALILFYEIKSSGKLHRRSIPLRDLNFEQTNETEILDNLLKTQHHSKYLREFSLEQLKRLMKMLIEKNLGLNINLTPEENNNKADAVNDKKETVATIDIEKSDLNKLADEDLNIVKNEMDQTFTKNQVKPGDAGWMYDNEVNFATNHGGIESSAWDDEDDSDMEF